MTRRPYQLARRAETAQETRRRIVQATFALHSAQGIAATTMKQIAERAGVSVGTVYHHFPTLDQTVLACGQMVAETFPPPGEEVFAGVAQLRERVWLLAEALWAHLDRLAYDRVRADLDKVEALRGFVTAEAAHRERLTQAALAPFAIDRDLARIAAALLDIDVYRSLQRLGLTLEAAAAAIADVIHARMTQKD